MGQNAKPMTTEYEYDINLPMRGPANDGMSNPGSVVGNYSDIKDQQRQDVVSGNISVKKSMLKIGQVNNPTDIRDRDMDMSPKSSKNDGFVGHHYKQF